MVLSEHGARPALPQTIDGLPVVEEVTGVIRPMAAAAHQVKADAADPARNLGRMAVRLAKRFCCGGTLGSLVKKGTTQ